MFQGTLEKAKMTKKLLFNLKLFFVKISQKSLILGQKPKNIDIHANYSKYKEN